MTFFSSQPKEHKRVSPNPTRRESKGIFTEHLNTNTSPFSPTIIPNYTVKLSSPTRRRIGERERTTEIHSTSFFLPAASLWNNLEDGFLDQSLFLVMEHNHLTIKTFMAITAERDAAIRERNMALEERKRAFAERDMAMLQRDAAIGERNSAIQERDNAIAALQYRESSMNDSSSIIPNDLGKHMQLVPYPLGEAGSYSPRNNDIMINITEEAPPETRKPRRKVSSKSSSKSSRVGKRVADGLSKQQVNNYASSNCWNTEQRDLGSDEDELDKQQVSWKDNLGLNQINFDESAMPVPVCSCTGSPQPCYRWGNGGWQSACCTTTISMYPLPQMANKRYSRVGGRKMSGSAFGKLLNRLAAEGYDFSTPLDLKDHWAKHGTNRYSTLK